VEDKDVNGAFTEEGALVRTNAACEPNVRITRRLPRCIYDICVCLCARRFTNTNDEKMRRHQWFCPRGSPIEKGTKIRKSFIRNRSETVAFAVTVSCIESCSCTASRASSFKRRREETALLVSTLRRRRRRAKTFVRSASTSSYF
jgi:hypothetical protein